MRAGWGWTVVATALLSASAAKACVPALGWPQDVKVNPREAAALLVQSASFIDLAEVETMTPDPVQAARGAPMIGDDAVMIHLRVIRRLLGDPATPVRDLSGVMVEPPPPPPNFRPRPLPAGFSLRTLSYSVGRQELAKVGISSCYSMHSIIAMRGVKVLVFREADGGLLDVQIPVLFHGRYRGVWGPSFSFVAGPDDPWVKLVDKEITDEGLKYVDKRDQGDYAPLQPGPAADGADLQAPPAPEDPRDSFDGRL